MTTKQAKMAHIRCPNGSWLPVVELFRVGEFFVNLSGGDEDSMWYGVTHAPSGCMLCESVPRKSDAIVLAKRAAKVKEWALWDGENPQQLPPELVAVMTAVVKEWRAGIARRNERERKGEVPRG